MSDITINIDLGARSYPIHIGNGLIGKAGALADQMIQNRHIVIIADEAVAPLYGEALEQALSIATDRIDRLSVPQGETAKSLASYANLMEALLALQVDRQTLLIALGGGVVGDLVGFAAASLLRGVDYIQVPTTLLAMVDSSVGGKTGINAQAGKNLIGAFHQPRLVIADIDCLNSLPMRELRAGYAEVVKYGLLGDADFFTKLEKNLPAIMAKQEDILAETIAHCCRSKAAIVEADEHEHGMRALLNLGHTFAHAYEAEAGYDDTVHHGEAVAVGLVDAFTLAALNGVSADDVQRVRCHLETAGLPVSRKSLGDKVALASAQTLLQHMRVDKKAINGKLTFIIPHGIGDARVDKTIGEAQVLSVLEEIR